MIVVEDNVVFESREAIEARVKEKWTEKGFNVSFEPYSVAQRLVDVWTDLLYDSQETVRSLYSRLSINASGEDLDRYLEKIGNARLRFPLLSFVWKNLASNISDRRFTYVVLPEEAALHVSGYNEPEVNYKQRKGQNVFNITQNLSWFEAISIQDKVYERVSENGFYKEKRRFVIEADIFDVEVSLLFSSSKTVIKCESKTLYPHKGAYQSGREFLYNEHDGSIAYRNADRAYLELEESDDAVRSRIITSGSSVGACENMLNRICARSRVQVESENDVKRYKITMIGFEHTEENIKAFWNICDSYLPLGWQLYQEAEEQDEVRLIVDTASGDTSKVTWTDTNTENAIWHDVDDNTGKQTIRSSGSGIPVRKGFFFIDNPSILYISGISEMQRDILNATGLPALVSYPTVYIALGKSFTVDLLTSMQIQYNTVSEDGDKVLETLSKYDDNAFVYSKSTAEKGSYFKVVVSI